MTLARLLEQATPGPWEFSDATDHRGHKGEFRAPSPYNGFMLVGPWINDYDARLIALAPEMAQLLIDMADWVGDGIGAGACNDPDCPCSAGRATALLARFAELERQAAR